MWLESPDIIDGEVLPRDLDDHSLQPTISELLTSLNKGWTRHSMTREEYREVYLKSPDWRAFRSLAIETSGRRCADCGRHSPNKQLDAHHLTYERLGGELLSDVVVVCRSCHDKRHAEGSLL